MQDKLQFIRFPVLLLTLYFVGKLVVGVAGGSYELGIRLFAMVPLTVHLCLAWGALIRALRGGGVKDAMLTGVLITLVAQLLIFMGTLGDPTCWVRKRRSATLLPLLTRRERFPLQRRSVPEPWAWL